MNVLEVKNIDVKYGNIKVLKNVSLMIEEGEIVSLIGANGAGKSTLLKSIVGMAPLAGGNIIFEKSMIASYSETNNNLFSLFFSNNKITTDKITKMGISLVPEGREVFADLTVVENLEMGAFLIKDKNKKNIKFKEMYDIFPILHDRRNQKAGSLSGGEQQMLAIARSLMSFPKLLLLDEPGLGLAPLIITDIFNIIKRINKEDNVTVLLVEQNAKMALKISNRGYVIETGKIVLHDESKKLLKNPVVQATYLGT